MRILTYPSKAAEAKVQAIAKRGLGFTQKDAAQVARIIADVRKNGDEALVRYTHRFDSPKITPDTLKVTEQEFEAAAKTVDRTFKRALNRAAAQIEEFHQHQTQKSWIHTPRPGTLLGQLVNPVGAAGIYVPGGKGGTTPLVSSVLMGAIPAKIAGVAQITMATPPNPDGTINPHLLAAAKKVGIHSVFKMGSAWAIAALAYGTESVTGVDMIVGPGNIYVTLAKKLVAGSVGIDMIAGPSEILIIADRSAKPEYAAADLLSQAEHDPLASAVLLTDSKATALAVAKALEHQLESLERNAIAAKSLAAYGAIVLVPDLETAVELANRMAPEHLELLVEAPFDYIGQIRNAGALFLGHHTPEPVGDYLAGPNHVLPTAGTARFSSALSVEHFIKKTSVIHYTQKALKKEAKDILRLAEIEGLGAHAGSVRRRL